MIVRLLAAIFVATAVSASPSDTENLHCMFLGYPQLEYDGTDRTTQLTEKTFNKTVLDSDEVAEVVFFHDVELDDAEYDQYECFLQLSAQIMTERGFEFYYVNTTKEAKIRKQQGIDIGDDEVHVYKDGNKIEYYGIRDPGVFISWLMDIPDDALTIINDDDDMDEFEDLEDESVRVVGYFEPGSAALRHFEDAAEDFMGEIEFYAVVHNTWARKLGLRRVGDIVMYRPFEDEPIFAPADVDTEHELEDWVEDNDEPLMEKLTLENYFDVWEDNDKKDHEEHMILAFVDEESEEGEAMFELLKELVNENEEHAGTLKIILIDPDEHPLMLDIWEDMFGIDIENGPQIGLVDLSEEDSLWFDMAQLNLEDADANEDDNEEVLQAWIDQILDGSIDLDDDDDDAPPPKKPSGKAPPPPAKPAAKDAKKKKEL